LTAANSSDPRQVVPRWRTWKVSASLGEAVHGFGLQREESTRSLENKLQDYQEKSDLGRTSDLLATAIVYGQVPREIENIASELLAAGTQWTLLDDLARRLLSGETVEADPPLARSLKDGWVRISHLKQILRNRPRNALRWVDLSREYMILGQAGQANKSMAIARHLAPQDRFVLRSAATLLAVAALRTSDTHLADPWLLAPLIALSDLAKDKPRGIRDALRLIEDGSLPRSHTAELAAAIGTMEFANGSDRRARQLFRLSLETPIENVLAQAVWLTEKKKISVISELPQQVNRAHEATSRQEAQKLRWVSATDSAMEWLEDQPFSTLAATYGSWTACESRNWTIAMAISERGLVIKPSNPILLNNLAYSQIQASNLKGAVATLIKARSVVIENEDKGALIATEGLALFRGGQLDAGRERYKSAIDLFVSLKKTDSAADAAIMVAMEEVSIDSVQMQPSIDRAIRLIKSVTNLRIHEHMGYLRDSLYAVGKSNLIEGWKAQKPEVVAQIL
jgi:hypothetical protein